MEAYRIAADRTREEAALATSVKSAAVDHWEKGRREPPADAVRALDRLYGAEGGLLWAYGVAAEIPSAEAISDALPDVRRSKRTRPQRKSTPPADPPLQQLADRVAELVERVAALEQVEPKPRAPRGSHRSA